MNLRHLGTGAALLLMTSAAAAEGLTEYKGTIKGTLVGRLEIYQADNTLEVAYAENRSDGNAVVTRGKSSWKVAGKWSVCEHADGASYCQLSGSSAVYRFSGAMTREDRAQPTYLLAATTSGYAARVTTATGDKFVHHASGGTDKVLASGKVTAAWSSGNSVHYMADTLTLRTISLTTFEVKDTKTNGPPVQDVEQNNSSSDPQGGVECYSTGEPYCEDYFGVSCKSRDQQCRCVDSSKGCAGCLSTCTRTTTYCPDPRTGEPECGDEGCGQASMAFGDGIMSVLDLCAGSTLRAFECDLARPGENCYSLPAITQTTSRPPAIQRATKTLSFGGGTLPAFTTVIGQVQPNGDILLEVPQD